MAGEKAKTFSCPSCGGLVTLRAAGHTISAICAHCSTVIDTANENFRIIKQYHERSLETDIPIGAKGIIGGTKWEVIGYVEKKDSSLLAFWDEYLLFNPYFGFSFLVQSDNHWSLARVIKRDVPLAGSAQQVSFDGEQYSMFYRGTSIVQYVKGEFYWRIHKGDREDYVDYIAPPKMLSVEKTSDEMTLSLGEYLIPAEVEQAFGIDLPRRQGIAANQPRPFANTLFKLWVVASCAMLAAFVIHVGSSGRKETVNYSTFRIEQDNAAKSFSSPVFVIPSRTNVVVRGTATPLRNNWVDLDLTLVNDASNNAYEASQTLEYYYGQDDGESWSEGNTERETYFTSVEPGNYRLVVEPAPGQTEPGGMDISLAVTRNVRAWSNFWAAVALIFSLPAYALIYRRYF
jgi:hypothetical protein